MGKEDLRHRAAHTTRELLGKIQARMDTAKRQRISALDQGHYAEPIVGGFYPEGRGTEIELFSGVYTSETPYTPTDLNDPPENLGGGDRK